MTTPSHLRYTAEHEWVHLAHPVRVGITDYAAEALGDIVFVDLPAVGDDVTVGDSCGEIESTKSVSELFAPVTGRIVAVNDAVATRPEVVGEDPYGDGWLFEIDADPDQQDHLLEADQYRELIGE